ncbi:MAG: PIN domain-containing protein [Chloroflexota bacterium]
MPRYDLQSWNANGANWQVLRINQDGIRGIRIFAKFALRIVTYFEPLPRCLRLSTEYKAVDDSIRKRAEQLEHLRIKALDALHVSCAEAAQASYFLTCDDRLISKRKYLNVRPLNPVEFVQKIIGVQP